MKNQNLLIVTVLVFSAIVIGHLCLCGRIENFKELSALPGLTHFRQFSFLPYYTKNVQNLGRRGCHSAQYWDCVHKHPDLKRGDPITQDIHDSCAKVSNDKCDFPARLSHSRSEPHYQYLDYA